MMGAIEGFWQALGALSSAQAIIVTAIVGLVTLSFGHALSAHLARRRDERLDQLHRSRVYAAFYVEIAGFRETVGQVPHIADLSEGVPLHVPNPAAYKVLRADLMKNLHLLEAEQMRNIMDSYIAIDNFDVNILKLNPEISSTHYFFKSPQFNDLKQIRHEINQCTHSLNLRMKYITKMERAK